MPGLAGYERRFRHAGLPLLIEGYSAREDIWTRAVPVLLVVLTGETLGAIDLKWSLLANVAALVGGVAILAGGLAAGNVLRERPALSRPRTVGTAELAGFVALPALLPLVFGGQTTSAWVTALANAGVLLALYAAIGYGVLWIVVWAARRLAGQLAASVLLLARAIPLLMLFAVVLFLTTEVWQVFARHDDRVIKIAALLGALGTLFLVVRIPREVRALEADVATGPALDGRQRFNVGLVMFISQALQVLVVTAAVGAFFVAVGLLALDGAIVRTWTAAAPDTVLHVSLFGADVRVYAELLRVSGAIAAFSGLYYAIAVLTDSTYREEFLSELTGELGATFRARAEYLEVLRSPASAASSAGSP
jgi:hypothetical protein